MRPTAQKAQPAHTLRLLLAGLLLAGGALAMLKPAHAGMAPLSDAELSQVNGRAAAPGPLQRDTQAASSAPLVGGLLSLFTAEQLRASLLDRNAFEAALAAHGMHPMPGPLYDGRLVTQIVIDAPPVSTSFEAGSLLSLIGVNYQGPSFGTINITNLDARGTTIWVWGKP